MKNIIFLLFLMIFSVMSCSKHNQSLELWYKQPAENWNEALPVGNGRLGAMVFGDPISECIQINEESIWAGSKINNNNPEALSNLPILQKAIFDGDIKKAEKLASKYFVGTPPRIRSYQPLGDLCINYRWNGAITNYRRSLDIQSGIAVTKFEVNGQVYEQKVFASAVDNVLVMEIKAMNNGRINALFDLKREKDALTEVSDDGRILFSGQIKDIYDPLSGPGGDHLNFGAEARFSVDKGNISVENNRLSIIDASKITVVLTAATNYNIEFLDIDKTIDPLAICGDILNKITKIDYDDLEETHITDHRSFFDRVSLDFGFDSLNYLSTDERLDRIKTGKTDNGLIALYFSYGRYLLMGSSRYPGVLPANLQGIWNKELKAPWNSDFHTNINLQMNYWPAEVCNLSETVDPLAHFLCKLTEPGAVTAKEMYGTNGWTMHHLTDPFGRTGVADGVWGLTPTNGPWMTFPIYEHYLFSGDLNYLKQTAYPIIKGAAKFLLGFLIPSPEGYLVTNPSTSPENRYRMSGSDETAQLTYSATIDIQTVNAVFSNCIEAASLLGVDVDFIRRIKEAQAKLPPVQISANGTIQEWINDYEEVEVGHRHMSHLLGLHPLGQITPETPELYEAAKNTIERRLSQGGGHTGWSRAWIINFYARLHKGDSSFEHIMSLLKKSTQKNLYDSHPPFQIDGNFGGTAGIAEMLLQSHQDFIELLPALPKEWKDGKVKGLVARGGFVIDITWRDWKVLSTNIHSKNGGTCYIKCGNKTKEIHTVASEDYHLNDI